MKNKIIISSAILGILLFSGCGDGVNRDWDDGTKFNHAIGSTPNEPSVEDDKKPFEPTKPDFSSIATDINKSGDQNNSSQDIYKTINGTYNIKITPEFDSLTAGQTQNIHFEIDNFFTKKAADDRAIKFMKFRIDENYAEFFDSKGRHGNVIKFGVDPETNKTYAKPVSVGDIAIKTGSRSGQLRINFIANIDGSQVALTKSFPITIEKNKSSSIAIVPYQTTYEKGLFTQKYVIHVVDSYGNKAKDGTAIQTGVINNPKLYSRGHISGVAKDFRAQLDGQNTSFKLKDQTLFADITNMDTLITLANQDEHKPTYLGGWDIEKVENESTLKLFDIEKDLQANQISYVIGDEYRYDECSKTIMNAAASTFTSTQVKDGVAYAELRYTPAMVGKDIFIYANSKVDDKKIGVSRRVTLTGTGLNDYTFPCNNSDGNTTKTCRMRFKMIENDSLKPAKHVNLQEPTNAGEPNYGGASITQTDCDGWTTVTIYDVPPKKSASVKFGGVDGIKSEVLKAKKQ